MWIVEQRSSSLQVVPMDGVIGFLLGVLEKRSKRGVAPMEEGVVDCLLGLSIGEEVLERGLPPNIG
jgi:hypothetical protein